MEILILKDAKWWKIGQKIKGMKEWGTDHYVFVCKVYAWTGG